METLWQHWTKKKEEPKPVMDLIHNELGFKAGQTVTIDILDYRARDYTILNVEEYVQEVGVESFYATDYVLEEGLRLRVRDFKSEAVCWLVTLHDEFAFNEDFLTVVRDAVQSQFSFDDEGIEFLPTSNSTKPMQVRIKNDLLEGRSLSVWQFNRVGKDEAGQEFSEFLIIEQDNDTGWFQLWRGFSVPLERVLVI